LQELQELWDRAFGFWSSEDLDEGRLFRFVNNAEAIAKVELDRAPQTWALARLSDRLGDIGFDAGPHSLTRTRLRRALYELAVGNDGARRAAAIRTLGAMRELGTLLALRDQPGEVSALADGAYHAMTGER
jgi:hypothetical protein